ncbi:Transposable element P transposase [Frankliniella fusca]|uniref:Transposable element P transposase n=1 Tax=Frankliniella fusca TaxID=407009 RepID=A0AAE1HGR2_9NEOP|nr:Transposable element P transposase [Frankliniella fusca]
MLARRKGKAHSAARTSDSRNQSNRLLDNEKPVEVNDPPPSAKTDNLDGKLLPSISVECSTDPSNSSMLSPEAESEHSYCASPDLTKTVLLDEPPKRVSTVGDISVTDLWLQVAVKLKLFLFHRWFVFVDKEALHVCYYSIQNALTVQRSLKVFESGAGEFYVHNQIVSLEEFTSDLDPPQPLSKDTVNSFVDRIASIVNCIRKKEVCTGYDDVKYRNAWFSCTVGEVDRNPFKECRYVETFRSFMCTRLIPNNKWRCGECAKMLKPLKRRSQSMAQDQANPNTKNIYLTEQQMLNKMQKQRSEINNAKKKIYRLQEKMQEILKKEGVPIDQSMSDAMLDILSQCEKLSPAQSIFLQQQIKASQQKHAAGMRWHPTIIRFALSLHLTSPAAYELMRETGMVKLPSSSTLFEYSHVKPVEEGVDKLVLESLAERVVFQKSSGKLLGYTTLDDIDREMKCLENLIENPDQNEDQTTASTVLVYMVKGVTNGIKEVVATFAAGKLSANQLYIWTWKVIGALEKSGIAVLAFVSDGSSVNRAFIKKNKPATQHPSGIVFDTWNKATSCRKLYFFADVPHLLKTIRNCLLNSRWDGRKSRRRMVKNGKKISWDFIIKLYEAKKGKSLRKSYKLNAMNVYPDSYGRMKVKLAGQVLSKTVSTDLRSQGWFDASETALFLEKVNDWFDCLNGAHSCIATKTRNKNLAAYTSETDERFSLIEDFLNYLSDWEKEAKNPNQSVNVSAISNASLHDADESEIEDGVFNPEEETSTSKRLLSTQTLDGIRMSSYAFQPAVCFMLQAGASFVNARVFTQDPLEQHFSKVRAGHGGSNNPNVFQVLNRNRALHTIGQLGMRKRKGNHGEDSNRVEVTTEPLPKRKYSRGPKFT